MVEILLKDDVMGHKEMCINYVESRKYEGEDGWWICDSNTGALQEGPFTETEIDSILWERAIDSAHEAFIP